MDAPKCKLCGERHYGLCGGRKRTVPPAVTVTPAVTPVTSKPVTSVTPRAKSVTPVTPSRCPQCEMYIDEIKRLKRELAEERSDNPSAVRMRRMRERRRIQKQ